MAFQEHYHKITITYFTYSMAAKTKSSKPASKNGVGQSLSNQRIVLWLLVGFVAFLTLWMLYTVKAMQAESMSTASEASNRGRSPYEAGMSCVPADSGKPRTTRKVVNGRLTSTSSVCCKIKGTAQYKWFDGKQCPVQLDYPGDAKVKQTGGSVQMKP